MACRSAAAMVASGRVQPQVIPRGNRPGLSGGTDAAPGRLRGAAGRPTGPDHGHGTATPSPTGRPSRPPAPWAPAQHARERRVVYQYSFKRSQHDNRAINKMIERAEAVAAGTRPLKKDRFVKITDAVKGVDWDLVERARYLAGLKGYVTNIDADTLDGPHVVTAYHELYQVERSFRMAKSDLAARPMFHRIRDSIEAHLTIVFAALAVSREAQARTGVSIKKIVQTLRPLRTATISLGHQQITAPPRIPDRRASHPRRPRRGWSLNRYNSGLGPGIAASADLRARLWRWLRKDGRLGPFAEGEGPESRAYGTTRELARTESSVFSFSAYLIQQWTLLRSRSWGSTNGADQASVGRSSYDAGSPRPDGLRDGCPLVEADRSSLRQVVDHHVRGRNRSVLRHRRSCRTGVHCPFSIWPRSSGSRKRGRCSV